MSDEIEVITVRDYVRDESLREVADGFLRTYGYSARECGEIRFTDTAIEFCIRRNTEDGFEWIHHERA